MTIEEQEARLCRLEDIHEINNLQGRYNHYLSMSIFDKIIDQFAKRDPNVKVEIADSGVYEGFEGVKRLFLTMGSRLFGRKGASPLMMIMTPVIELSRDGKTAKGIWHSFGCITMREETGPYAAWVQGKYDNEFVKEDGQWKFRSLRWYVNFRTPFDQGWVKKPIVNSMTFADTKPDKPSTYYMPYNPDAFNVCLPEPVE
jgi:hypothetical protein